MAIQSNQDRLLQLQQLQQMAAQGGQQKLALLKQAQTPVDQIAQSANNRPQRAHGLAGWYELNPGAVQGETWQQEQARQKATTAAASQVAMPGGVPKTEQANPAHPHQGIFDSAMNGISGLVKMFTKQPKQPGAGSAPAGAGQSMTGVQPSTEPGVTVDPQHPGVSSDPVLQGWANTANNVKDLRSQFSGMALPETGPPAYAKNPTPQATAQQGVPSSMSAPQAPTIPQLGDTKFAPPAPGVSNFSAPQGLTNLAMLPTPVVNGVDSVAKYVNAIASNANSNLAKANQVTAKALGRVTSGTASPGKAGMGAALKAEQAAAKTADVALKVAGKGQGLANLAGGSSRLGAGLKVAGKVAAPVQAAMMALEAARLVGDEQFRNQSTQDFNGLEKKGALGRMWQSLGSPISTIYNSGKAVGDVANSMSDASASGMALGRAKEMAAKRAEFKQQLQAMGLTQAQIRKELADMGARQSAAMGSH